MNLANDIRRIRHKPLMLLFSLFTITYLWLTFATPPESVVLTKYGLTAHKVYVLRLATVIPYILIWFIALFGYIKFRNYARSIQESREGRALKLISDGLLVLAIMLPLNTILSNTASYLYHRDPSIKPLLVIMTNYITLIILLFAFTIIGRGARKLQATLSYSGYTWRQWLGILLLTILALLYVFLLFTNPDRRSGGSTAFNGTYLPDWVLALTIVLPYLYIWYLGMVSALRISTYSLRVKGILYKAFLRYLANGVALVVLGQMSVRYLTSLSSHLDNVGLQFLLLIIYIVLFLIGIGFGLIAYGAHKLQKIESV